VNNVLKERVLTHWELSDWSVVKQVDSLWITQLKLEKHDVQADPRMRPA
jgi:hypothetical protein